MKTVDSMHGCNQAASHSKDLHNALTPLLRRGDALHAAKRKGTAQISLPVSRRCIVGISLLQCCTQRFGLCGSFTMTGEA